MGFGQHQSFYLRSNWITKAIEKLEKENFFSDKDHYLELGIGKNMFSSLKHWMVATGVAQKKARNQLELSDFGLVLKKYDINCIKVDSKSIMHYYLCADPDRAEIWYWFFNVLEGNKFIKENLFENGLKPWIQGKGKNVSEKTLKKDLDCLIQVYTNAENLNDPEDTIYSPLASLELMTTITREDQIIIEKKMGSLASIGEGALMYILIRHLEENATKMVSVDDLISKENLWGRIFNMNRQAIIEALNTLSLNPYNKLYFIRTNDLDTVVCEYKSSKTYLENYYQRTVGD